MYPSGISLLISLLLFLGGLRPLLAQQVVTVAGEAGVNGEADGAALTEARFNNPHGVAADAAGNVYIADRWNHKIRKLTPNGQVSTVAGTGEVGTQDGPGATATFHEPWGIAAAPDGTLYVADSRNHRIRIITPDGMVSTLAGDGVSGVVDGPGASARFALPTGITVAGDGYVYVCDHLGHTIRQISPGGFVSTLAGSPMQTGSADGIGAAATFYRPYGMELGPDNNLYVADEWNHLIRRVTLAGQVTTVAGTGALGSLDGPVDTAQLNYPWDVTLTDDGTLFIMDGGNHVIRRVSPGGMVDTYAGEAGTQGAIDGEGPDASFNGATSLTHVPGTEVLYVGDAYNHLIRRVGEVPVVPGTPVLSGADADSLCLGSSLTLTVTGAEAGTDTFAFFLDGEEAQRGPSPVFSWTASAAGTYTIFAETESGGAFTGLAPSRTFTFIPAPEVQITAALLPGTEAGQRVELRAVGDSAQSYRWEAGDGSLPGFGNPWLHTYTLPDTYTVSLIVAGPFGCRDTLSYAGLAITGQSPNPPADTTAVDTTQSGTDTLVTTPPLTEPELPTETQLDLFLPTAFTPNGDGLNDYLRLRGTDRGQATLMVFDAWGACLYTGQGESAGWDGTYRGRRQPPDSYVAVVRGLSRSGQSFSFSQIINLIR
ncbi:MAG: hypothetical protein D6722_02805 [Bacteroidetes bacterium]|nr:MAG: hypothetical protein D6722_02805 [Bacteroidota bacterium]